MRLTRWFFLAVLVSTLAGPVSGYENEVKQLSATMADQIAQAGRKSIAVVDFTDLEGNPTELGRFLAEEFAVALASSGKGFEVVDRNNLKAILQEHKLAASGLIDPATAKKFGQIVGVEALITGTLTPFGDSVRLVCKVLDTSTARVIGGARGDIPRTKAIDDLLGRGLAQPGQASSAGQPPASSPAWAPARSAGAVAAQAQPGSGAAPSSAQSGSARPAAVAVVANPAPPTPPPAGDVEASDTVFHPVGCRGVSSRVTCALLVTNERNEARTFYAEMSNEGILLVDDQGSQYRPDEAMFGGTRRAASWGYIQVSLPPAVPMRLELSFPGFNASATSATLALRFSYVGTGDWTNVTIRGLAVTR